MKLKASPSSVPLSGGVWFSPGLPILSSKHATFSTNQCFIGVSDSYKALLLRKLIATALKAFSALLLLLEEVVAAATFLELLGGQGADHRKLVTLAEVLALSSVPFVCHE